MAGGEEFGHEHQKGRINRALCNGHDDNSGCWFLVARSIYSMGSELRNMSITVKIRGDKKLERAVNKLSSEARKKAIPAAVVAGALVVANDAKRKAPVLTGTLRRSLHIGGHGDKTPGHELGPPPTKPLPPPKWSADTLVAFVGTDLIYAAPVEFGTSKRTAKPYLRPALDQNHQTVQAEMRAVLRQFIRSARP